MTGERIQLDEPSQAVLREARRLQRRKDRKEAGAFLVEGRQGVREALASPGVVSALFVRWSSVHDNLDLVDAARASGVQVYAVSEQNLATLSDMVTPQGIVAVARCVDVSLSEVLGTRRKDPTLPKRKRRRARDKARHKVRADMLHKPFQVHFALITFKLQYMHQRNGRRHNGRPHEYAERITQNAANKLVSHR